MPKLLRKLRIDRIDLVKSGASYDYATGEGSHVMLAKARRSMKTEDGTEYPAEAYAYAPDPDSPSTWKLRLWESHETHETRAQVARAVQAIEPEGFRGRRAEVPESDLAGVKARLRAAWKKVEPDEDPPASIRKDGILSRAVAKVRRIVIPGNHLRQIENAHDALGQMIADIEYEVEDEENEEEKTMPDQNVMPATGHASAQTMAVPGVPAAQPMAVPGVLAAAADTLEQYGLADLATSVRAAVPSPLAKAMGGLSSEVRDAIAKMQKEAVDLRAEVVKQQVARERDQWVAKARAELGTLGASPETIGPALRDIAVLAPDAWKVLEPVLKGASEAIRQGALFSEVGTLAVDAAGGGSAWVRIEKAAQDRITKGQAKTFPEAMDAVLRGDPGLYAEYFAEQSSNGGFGRTRE